MATATAELVMLVAALALIPARTLDRGLLRNVGQALCGAAVMVAVVVALGDVPPLVGMVAAGLAYVAVVALVGGIGIRDVRVLVRALRARATPPAGP